MKSLDVIRTGVKRMRAELLVKLKDHAGLTYAEIAKIDIFGDLKINSLGSLYQNALKRMKGKKN